jgi:aminoglycoside N3'-acetyltransferase
MTGRRQPADLIAELRSLGVQPGQDLLVHSSLRSIGRLANGAATLLDALRAAAGPAATIVVPTFTPGNSGSSAMFREATRDLDRAAVARYLASMPGFERRSTPSQGMGGLAEYVRICREASRSAHPQTSFAAIGPRAREATEAHDLDCHLGDQSPLGWLWKREAAVLLLGVDYDKCTAFHLAEYRLSEDPPTRAYHFFTHPRDARQPGELWDVDLDETDFAALGERIDGQEFVSKGRVGSASCRLLPLRQAVDFAVADPWFRQRRMAAADSPAAAHGARTALAGPGRLARHGRETASRYFFLSYSRLPPLPPVPGIDVAEQPDDEVHRFFRDLGVEVGRRATPGSAVRPGFLDLEVPASSHWRSGLADVLGSAEAFVPLLGPDYYRRSWPATEWRAFERRVRDARPADPADPGSRFVPVLWEALPADRQPPGLAQALSLAAGRDFRPYADLGLRTLLRRGEHRVLYERILGLLASRIVALAEQTPIGPSWADIPDECAPLGEAAEGRVFFVTVLGGRGRSGATPADYVRLSAERLGFAVRVREHVAGEPDFTRHPGIVLVEPPAWESAAAVGLDEILAGLPPWVSPLIVTARAPAQPGASGIKLEKTLKAYFGRPEIALRGLEGVSSLRTLDVVARFLIAHTEREYLRLSPVRRAAADPVFRPRLAGGPPHPDQPGKEEPHA